MKSKIILLVLAVFVASTSLAGCRRATSIKVPDQSIPFLTLVPESVNNESIKKAYLNFWDLKNGKIIKTDKVIYTVVPGDITYDYEAVDWNKMFPFYWDGKDCIILPAGFKIITNLYKRTEFFELSGRLKDFQIGTRVIFGKDVEMIRAATDDKSNYKYTLKVWNGDKYIEHEIDLNYKFKDTNSQPSRPIAIGNDATNLNILVSGGYNPQTGMDVFLCTVDIGNWTTKWYKISVEKTSVEYDAVISPGKSTDSSNCTYLDGSFYVPSGCCSIAKIDTKELICSRWKKIVSFKLSEEDIGYNTSILGNFNDTIIVQFVILRGTGNERYICAFKNGEGLGMMHLTNGNVEIMDKDGNILSNATLNENSSIIFPKMNGGM